MYLEPSGICGYQNSIEVTRPAKDLTVCRRKHEESCTVVKKADARSCQTQHLCPCSNIVYTSSGHVERMEGDRLTTRADALRVGGGVEGEEEDRY